MVVTVIAMHGSGGILVSPPGLNVRSRINPKTLGANSGYSEKAAEKS